MLTDWSPLQSFTSSCAFSHLYYAHVYLSSLHARCAPCCCWATDRAGLYRWRHRAWVAGWHLGCQAGWAACESGEMSDTAGGTSCRRWFWYLRVSIFLKWWLFGKIPVQQITLVHTKTDFKIKITWNKSNVNNDEIKKRLKLLLLI